VQRTSRTEDLNCARRAAKIVRAAKASAVEDRPDGGLAASRSGRYRAELKWKVEALARSATARKVTR
jgi:hypothetical protein